MNLRPFAKFDLLRFTFVFAVILPPKHRVVQQRRQRGIDVLHQFARFFNRIGQFGDLAVDAWGQVLPVSCCKKLAIPVPYKNLLHHMLFQRRCWLEFDAVCRFTPGSPR